MPKSWRRRDQAAFCKLLDPVFELNPLMTSGRRFRCCFGAAVARDDLCERSADYLTGQGLFLFRYVAVDEAQDFGPRELRFVRALAPEGPHSLFFVADAGQRIARWPFAWSDVGIDIRGRGRRLTVPKTTFSK